MQTAQIGIVHDMMNKLHHYYYLSIFSNEVYSNSGTRVCIWLAGIFLGLVCAIGKRSFGRGLLERKFIYQGSDVPTIIYYGVLGDKCRLTP